MGNCGICDQWENKNTESGGGVSVGVCYSSFSTVCVHIGAKRALLSVCHFDYLSISFMNPTYQCRNGNIPLTIATVDTPTRSYLKSRHHPGPVVTNAGIFVSFFSFVSVSFSLLFYAGCLSLLFFTASHYFCFSTGTSKPLPVFLIKSDRQSMC